MTVTTEPQSQPSEVADSEVRTYTVRTMGCQMNVHDSEHMAGLLESAGYVPAEPQAADRDEVDVIVINTCAVRENAAGRLYGNLGQLAAKKRQRPQMQIAVGGCLAQKDRQSIVDRAPWVDVVFGTHNIDILPALLDRARHNGKAQVEIAESLQVFPSTLPTSRESVYAGWVSISVGCNNTCTFCIVPHLRGKERDRNPQTILAEIEALVDQGTIEVTLLGQNVNSYGVEFGDRGAFAKLLRACGEIRGLERVRFTSPHPAAFTDDVIAAMAETPNVMPQLHMPLQSGSDRILRAMRRSYRSERFLGILDRVRERIPHAAITSDIIVGFPGETDEDFEQTLQVVRQARFASAYTFQYSPRPGTAAYELPTIPDQVMAERYQELMRLQDSISLSENQKLVGKQVEILVTEDSGRKDQNSGRVTGRAADNRLVHASLPASVYEVAEQQNLSLDELRISSDLPAELPRPGDLITVEVTQAAPFYLTADSAEHGGIFQVRRTSASEAWLNQQKGGCSDHGSSAAPGPVVLGLPTLRTV